MIAALFALAAFADPEASPDAPVPVPIPANCTVIDGTEASLLLGYTVQDPDEVSRTGGTCFYISRSASEDGSLSYAVVTAASLPQRRAYFHAYSIRCAPAAKGTLNELACRQFIALSHAQTIDEYFAARSSAGDATVIPGLGDAAVASGNAVYVRRGDAVYETSVVRSGDFDLERTTKLAVELLGRTAPAPSPMPSATA